MGQSLSQITSNITNSIADVIVNTVQQSQNNINLSQKIDARCDVSYLKQNLDDISSKITLLYKQGKSIEDISKIINGLYGSICNIDNINLNYTLDINQISKVLNKTNVTLKTNITNNLSQMVDGADTNQEINNVVNSISNVLADLGNKISTDTSLSQTIEFQNYSANRISMSATSSFIANYLSSNSTTSSAINKIAVTIQQVSISKNQILIIALAVIAIIILIGFFIWLTMKLKNSPNLHDFFIQLSPYLIILLGSIVVIAPQLALIPDYLSYKSFDKDSTKHLSIPKAIGYSILYFIIITLITIPIYIFVIKKKLSTNAKKISNNN